MVKSSFQKIAVSFSIITLCLIVLVQNLLPSEFLPPIVVSIACLILIMTGSIKVGYLKLIWPLLVVLFLGLIGLQGHEHIDILRDIAYALTPIALIFIGYWMADNKSMWPIILKVIVGCGFVLAIVHLSEFVRNPSLLGANLVTVRKEVMGTGGLVVLSFILGLFQSRLGVGDLFPKYLPRYIVMPVLLVSFTLSYSRTGLLQMIIFSLALGGILGRVRFRMIFVVGLIVAGSVVIVATTPKDEEQTFRGKLIRSVTEVSVEDYVDFKDINVHWRGFETYQVVNSFVSGDLHQKIIGQGAGVLVDLGFTMKLNDENFRYIPVFHNGYAYVLIKTGLLGIGCYIFFYLNTIRLALISGKSLNRRYVFFSRLLLGCVLSLTATMYIAGGMAEVHDAEFVLLVGYLVRLIQRETISKDRSPQINALA